MTERTCNKQNEIFEVPDRPVPHVAAIRVRMATAHAEGMAHGLDVCIPELCGEYKEAPQRNGNNIATNEFGGVNVHVWLHLGKALRGDGVPMLAPHGVAEALGGSVGAMRALGGAHLNMLAAKYASYGSKGRGTRCGNA